MNTLDLKTFSKIGEKEIVYICDKLIKGTELVTLNERFEESFKRYEYSPDILKNVNKRYDMQNIIKKNIENILENSLENLR